SHERLVGRLGLDDHVIVSRGEAAAVGSARGDVPHDEHDDLRAQSDQPAEAVLRLAGGGGELEIRATDPPVAEKAAAVAANYQSVVGSRDIGVADAGEDHPDVAQTIVEIDGGVDLALDIGVGDDGAAIHRRHHHAEVHLLAQADAQQRAEEVEQADQAPDHFGHPVDDGAQNAAEDRDAENHLDEEADRVEHDVDHLAHHARNPLADGDDHEGDDLHQYPGHPAQPLVAAQAPPVAVLLLADFLQLVHPGLDGFLDLFLDPVLDFLA